MIRDVWRALPITQEGVVRRAPKTALEVVWHHTAGNVRATPQDVAAVHLARGWPHIGYHYLIAGDGTVFKTLPISYRPICVRRQNTKLLCVAFIGNYHQIELVPAQIEAAQKLLELLQRHHRVTRLAGHRDYVPTLCPGYNAYRELQRVGLIES